MSEPAELARALRQRLEQANYEYYVLDAPVLSDREYDRLFRELQELEERYPALRTPDSPTLRIGAPVQSQLAKHTHLSPMLSLGNAFSDAELRAWEERMLRIVGSDALHGYTAELKIDGAAIALTYSDGVLTVGATRGNGTVGENVTANVRTVKGIPLRLRGSSHPPLLEIRGEIYIPFDGFERMNLERAASGEPLFANPRNSAAGTLRQLDPAITAARPLRFFAYGIALPPGSPPPAPTQWESIQLLTEWGLPTAPHTRLCTSLAEVEQLVAETEAHTRADLNFAIDGIVVKVNSLSVQEELGVVGEREPRWAIARKFAPDIAVTRLLDIRVNVGRTGTINPFAVLEPVEVGGATIQLATLHNEEYIAKRDLRLGDWVQVKRAGEVIPQVIAPLPDRRDSGEKPWHFPTTCPACGSPLTRDEDESAWYCTNIGCQGRRLEALVHFAARDSMDIRGLSYQRMEQLVQSGLVSDFADLYELHEEELASLERLGPKSAAALVAAIADSKARPLSRLLHALGIRHVGVQNAQILARHFGTMEQLAAASEDQIAAIHGIGPRIAHEVRSWFADPDAAALLRRLSTLGVNMAEQSSAAGSGILKGKTVVITGTLPTLSRQEATRLVESAGGKVTSAVSRSTGFVVAGENPGSKLVKAGELGVEVIDEDELKSRLNQPR